jgi:hypothetical protein
MEWILLWIGVNAVIGYAIGKSKNEVGASVLLSILLGPIGWLLCIANKARLGDAHFAPNPLNPKP